MGITPKEDTTLPTIVINDGRVMTGHLHQLGKTEEWLQRALQKEGCSSPAQVFLLLADERGSVTCVKKEAQP